MITTSGTGVRGRVDLAIWECPLTAIIYAHVFCSSARKFNLCTDSHTGTDRDEGWKMQLRLAPIHPCFLLSPSAHWTAVRSHCKVCSGGAALRLAILKYIKLSLQKREALFAADLVMQHPSLMSKSLGKIKRWGSCIGCQQSWQPLPQNYLQQWFLGFPTAYFFSCKQGKSGTKLTREVFSKLLFASP